MAVKGDEHMNQLLIIGAGHLGARVARVWLATSGSVLAETRSTNRHSELVKLGAAVRVATEPDPTPADNVLFCVAASHWGDDAALIRRAIRLWTGKGRFVLTSSTGVYAERDGGRCDEASPTGGSDRAETLLAAERVVLAAGGAVVRLAGLYDDRRGPHRVYSRSATSVRRADGLINLVHEADAARVCVAALQIGKKNRIYLACDGSPVTREALVAAAMKLPGGGLRTQFEPGSDDARGTGRRCDGAVTGEELDWRPRWSSFEAWARYRGESSSSTVCEN